MPFYLAEFHCRWERKETKRKGKRVEQLYLIVTLKIYELYIHVGSVSNLITFHDGQLCMNSWRIIRWHRIGCIFLSVKEIPKRNLFFFLWEMILKKNIGHLLFFIDYHPYWKSENKLLTKLGVGKNWKLKDVGIKNF